MTGIIFDELDVSHRAWHIRSIVADIREIDERNRDFNTGEIE